jgi:GT2 family glycosyltransferase
MQPQVTVVVVTFNSLPYLESCLASLQAQTCPLEVVIVDNASSDGTAEFLRHSHPQKSIFNQTNVGFAAAQNQGIRASGSPWVLTLNPDVVLDPNFVATLVEAGWQHRKAGTVCGKLLRWQPDASKPFSNVIDSTGIYFRPDLRHLDRGAEESDRGQYNKAEFVFGATGAAALYRRAMIEDISINGEFFDEDFFAYREDADLSWRAQLLGWKCLYIPQARGWHVRRVTPERRSIVPREINWHSVKNRFLMRMKNAEARLWLRLLPQILARDIAILGYALLVDRGLFSALLYPLKNWRTIMAKRRAIQSRRRAADGQLVRWFDYRPQVESLPMISDPGLRREAS